MPSFSKRNFSAFLIAVVITANFSYFTQNTAYAADDVTWSTNTSLSAGDLVYGACSITNNSTVTVTSATTSLTCSSLTIDAGSKLSADSQGEAEASGSGAGGAGAFGGGGRSGGGGAGYGGSGGAGGGAGTAAGGAGGSTYGSYSNPTNLGSGGGLNFYGAGSAGAGGGYINLIVSGTLTVSGSITANGQDGIYDDYSGAGGGSGGSIKIDAGTVAGAGSITANGGNGYNAIGPAAASGGGGGGGGGRILINFDVSNSITPTVSGGTGGTGGAGGSAGSNGGTGSTVLVNQTTNSVTYASASNFTLPDTTYCTGGVCTYSGLTINSGTTVTVPSSITSIVVNGNATVTGTLSANGQGGAGGTAGNPGGTGSGSGGGGGGNEVGGGFDISGGGGGGYGGAGGAGGDTETKTGGAGGTTYGSTTSPAAGSGGGGCDDNAGGSGGGYVNLSSTGTLTVNGTISANGSLAGGQWCGGGGGSGGGIKIDTGTITFGESGWIKADGGNGGKSWQDDGYPPGTPSYGESGGGGGGGGRVYILYDTVTGGGSEFTSHVEVAGGEGGGITDPQGHIGVNGSAGATSFVPYTVPSTPSITAPVNEATGVSKNPTITSSAFSSNGRTHTTSDWEVCTDSACSTVVWYKYDDATNKESIVVNNTNGTFQGVLAEQTSLSGGTTYYTRVRHTNSIGDSSYSAITSFTTINTAPTATINSAVQKTDGTGTVDISVTVDDDDNDDTLQLKVEYKAGADCSSGTSDPTLDETDGNTTATYGDPKVLNTNEYQVGNSESGYITTSSGANTVLFDWASKTDLPSADTLYCIKITPYDDIATGTAQTTTLTLDNKNPATNALANISSQPQAGDTAVTVNGSFTETNPNTNNFYLAINGGAYGDASVGQTNTATPAAKATTVGATLKGNDYISKVKIVHSDDYGNTFTNENPSPSNQYVKPYTPAAPTVENPTESSLDVTVNENVADEVDTVKYAINETTTGNYVQADGSLGGSAIYQTISTWGTITVTGLTSPVSTYTFKTIAQNPSDESGETLSEWSATTNIDNTTPTISIDSVSENTDGENLVEIIYTIIDPQSDTQSLSIYDYSTDDGGTWNAMTEGVGSDGISDLSSSPGGTEHTLIWDIGIDLPDTEISTIITQLQANDGVGNGNTDTSSPFIVDTITPSDLADFTVSDTTMTTATLTWTITTDGYFNHYEIWYGEDSADVENREDAAIKWDDSDDENLAIISTNTTTITDLTSNTTYYFKIWAVDDYGHEYTVDIVSGTTNTPPTVADITAAEATDGSGEVSLSFVVDDADDNDCKAKIEYSIDSGVTWSAATLDETDSTIENDNEYQVGNESGYISTSAGPNTVSVVWLSQTDEPTADISNAKIRITPNDLSIDGDSVSSDNFILDNVAPTAPGSFTAERDGRDIDLSWTAPTETNFNHYEIWYGATSGAAENRTGTEHDNNDDANLVILTTTSTTTMSFSNGSYYFKIWAVDNYGNENYNSGILSITISSESMGGTYMLTLNDSKRKKVSPKSDLSDLVESTEPLSVESFSDISTETASDWESQVIELVISNHLFTGEIVDGKRIFNPNIGMNRAMAATVISRYVGCVEGRNTDSGFEDIPADAWFSSSVACLKANGIINGTSLNKFSPADTVTQIEFLKMLVNAYLYKHPEKNEQFKNLMIEKRLSFADVLESDWFYPYVNLAYNLSIIHGFFTDGKWFAEIGNHLTRIEAASLITEFLNLEV